MIELTKVCLYTPNYMLYFGEIGNRTHRWLSEKFVFFIYERLGKTKMFYYLHLKLSEVDFKNLLCVQRTLLYGTIIVNEKTHER